MKRIGYCLLLIVLCFSFVLTGCNGQNSMSEDEGNRVKAAEIEEPTEEVEIKFWTYNNGWSRIIKSFETIHPKIKINVERFPFEEISKEYKKAVLAGNGPDILYLDSGYYYEYTTGEYFEDLLKEPYLAGRYEKDFPEDMWECNKSLNGNRLISMTFLTSPFVTYYRADIMEENGFPSEPNEFGKFIENPDNLIAIAKKLKSKGQYIFQMPTDLINLLGSSTGVFDKDLNFVRDSSTFVDMLDLSKKIYQSQYILGADLWSDIGREAIKNDKLVMIITMGSWGTGTIQEIAPEQAGKWRIAKLPLGLTPWYSDTKLAIDSQSKNKKWAWLFLEYVVTQQEGGENIDMISGYLPARKNMKIMLRENVFYGDQLAQPLFEDLALNMVQYRQSPLDGKALEIFNQKILEAIENDIDSKKAIRDIADEVKRSVEEERKALLK
ncbi:MAG TPA: extracellular solute-binding protein [Acetivibrio sp.]|nr:extracellular solute-binding protein [Acetivibrio sp.]